MKQTEGVTKMGIGGVVSRTHREILINVSLKKAESNKIECASGKVTIVECKKTRKTSHGKSEFCFL